ncbi:hypothetical protein [Rhizobium sp. PL01]|uniref:hypothetical protein n=1 Tax=Rhizobium sp. PL01 TaxID=3085631 RepID=UPI00298229BA|nr:hypothetical protein [Rhizobium sp. PL01]MDW5317859.1 hypothetical protein [Rhizobium sp. PL01]
MTESCPIPTPAERKIGDIIVRSQQGMMENIHKAIEDAISQATEELHSAGLQHEADHQYFAAVANQQLFLFLCGADPETFAGGDPEMAAHIISNNQNISHHYFGKKGKEPVSDTAS